MRAALTPDQRYSALDSIASLASAVADLALTQIESAKEPDRVCALATAIAALANQIGWTADLAGAHHRNDATDWLMPPTFHECAKPEAPPNET